MVSEQKQPYLSPSGKLVLSVVTSLHSRSKIFKNKIFKNSSPCAVKTLEELILTNLSYELLSQHAKGGDATQRYDTSSRNKFSQIILRSKTFSYCLFVSLSFTAQSRFFLQNFLLSVMLQLPILTLLFCRTFSACATSFAIRISSLMFLGSSV